MLFKTILMSTNGPQLNIICKRVIFKYFLSYKNCYKIFPKWTLVDFGYNYVVAQEIPHLLILKLVFLLFFSRLVHFFAFNYQTNYYYYDNANVVYTFGILDVQCTYRCYH